MKKQLALLLLPAALLTASACGSKQAETEETTAPEAPVIETQVVTEAPIETEPVETEADDSIIEFDNVVLLDDDTMCIELVNFYAEDRNWADLGTVNEKYITLRVTNKSDHDFFLNPGQFYVNGEEMFVSAFDSIDPAPGKTSTCNFMVAYDTKPDHTPLDSMDELYGMECSLSGVNTYEDSSQNTNLEVSFTIPTASELGSGDGTGAVTETKSSGSTLSSGAVSIDGICVDDSYQDEDGSSLRLVYLFYTVSPGSENLRAASTSTTLTIAGGNSYNAEGYSVCDYFPNYHYNSTIKDVYVGETKKVAATFLIPEAELAAGQSISLSDGLLSDMSGISLSTDDVQHFNSEEEMAAVIDPEGYAAELAKREPADAETTAKAESLMNGYKWDFYVNSTSYQIEFYSGDTFELRVPALGVTNSGSYTVGKGYIFCTFSSNGTTVDIPYEFTDSDIDLDVVAAWDVF